MVTEQQLRDYLNLHDSEVEVSSLLEDAQIMLDREIGDQYVPSQVRDRALKIACSDLQLRNDNPGGIVNYAGGDEIARLSVDPMRGARAVLAPWIVQGI
jgi:hypothetical protein